MYLIKHFPRRVSLMSASIWLAIFAVALVARSAESDSAGTNRISPGDAEQSPSKTVRADRSKNSEFSAEGTGKIERNVVYGKVDDVELKLDIYFPRQTGSNLSPVAMYVHGGGWEHGDKALGAGALIIHELVRRGYLVASINYRLAPQYKFPAQIEDAKCAVRFLRANAKKYRLDSNRIGVWGGSAGGHLVALLGLADVKAGFDGVGGHAAESSKVHAVVDMFGPTDLTVARMGEKQRQLLAEVFGASDDKEGVLKRASPVTYIKKDAPPFLILQGEEDKLVAPEQSRVLDKRLKEAGVSSQLIMVKHAGHSFLPSGGKPSPSPAEIIQIVADFFDKSLKGH
jgi:acetyl esterase/lipase